MSTAEGVDARVPRWVQRQRDQALDLVRAHPYGTTDELRQAAEAAGLTWARHGLRQRLVELREAGEVRRHGPAERASGAVSPMRERWSTPDGPDRVRAQAAARERDAKAVQALVERLEAVLADLGTSLELRAEIEQRLEQLEGARHARAYVEAELAEVRATASSRARALGEAHTQLAELGRALVLREQELAAAWTVARVERELEEELAVAEETEGVSEVLVISGRIRRRRQLLRALQALEGERGAT